MCLKYWVSAKVDVPRQSCQPRRKEKVIFIIDISQQKWGVPLEDCNISFIGMLEISRQFHYWGHVFEHIVSLRLESNATENQFKQHTVCPRRPRTQEEGQTACTPQDTIYLTTF